MSKKAAPRRVGDNEAMAVARNLRTSPRKLGLVVDTIRGRRCADALAALAFSRRRIAKQVKKVLESAIANAENNHQLDVDRLYVAEAQVGRGLVIKRWRPRARGRVGSVQKPFSHLRLVVGERAERPQGGEKD